MAFMQSSAFNVPGATEWPLFSTVQEVRSRFALGTAVMIAIGGWGDTEGFSKAATTDTSRKLFARNIKKMIEETGADGKVFISMQRIHAVFWTNRSHRCGY